MLATSVRVFRCLAAVGATVALSRSPGAEAYAQMPPGAPPDTALASVAPPPPRGLDAFLRHRDTFSRKRFGLSAGIAAGLYAANSTWLYLAWYKDGATGGFRTIDDRREWEGMDKLGHVYSTYSYARVTDQGLRWTGMPRGRRVVLSVLTGMVLQTTVEVMDGFSADWGFSWADMGANALGAGVYAGQALAFREQRAFLKFSASPQSYPTGPLPSPSDDAPASSAQDHADRLFGTSPWTRLIKDYGGQTIWLSTNPTVLLGGGDRARLPWLMLSAGYSPNNVLGAYTNAWSVDGFRYDARAVAPRTRQYLLSLDVDFTRIPTRSRALKTVFFFANVLKVPAPAVLFDSEAGWDWRWVYY